MLNFYQFMYGGGKSAVALDADADFREEDHPREKSGEKGGQFAEKHSKSEEIDDISDKSSPSDEASANKSPKKPLVTPEEDAAYMEAVGKGDMKTAAKMVREVAGRAFPNTKVVDEDGLPQVLFHGTADNFSVFDLSKTEFKS